MLAQTAELLSACWTHVDCVAYTVVDTGLGNTLFSPSSTSSFLSSTPDQRDCDAMRCRSFLKSTTYIVCPLQAQHNPDSRGLRCETWYRHQRNLSVGIGRYHFGCALHPGTCSRESRKLRREASLPGHGSSSSDTQRAPVAQRWDTARSGAADERWHRTSESGGRTSRRARKVFAVGEPVCATHTRPSFVSLVTIIMVSFVSGELSSERLRAAWFWCSVWICF